MSASQARHPASFRDPSGFVFERGGELYRQVNDSYRENYDRLMRSGLYESLARDGLLIPHVEVGRKFAVTETAYQVIRPDPIPFVSYPYEWCFSQLKHAALLTLEIQQRALGCGMTLKDASAYNIQFREGQPVLIDTLSFEIYREGEPWRAYRQFCQHFLAPLALMSYVDVRFQRLVRPYLGELPLDLASILLPLRTRLHPGLLSHLHLQAAAQAHIATRGGILRHLSMGGTAFRGLIHSLESTVSGLNWQPRGTVWHDYASTCEYSPAAIEDKKRIVAELLDKVQPIPQLVWDLGANVGTFSRIASDRGILTIAFDQDEAAVEKNYRAMIARHERTLLPLVMDLTNPSPGLGWASQERMSWMERGPADAIFALALVHHLVISNNVSFRKLADLLSRLCRCLIIEFVPRHDPQVQRLMQGREDIFEVYGSETFHRYFGDFFEIEDSRTVVDTERTIYLMVKRNA
jgi:hypothetical protein